MRLRATLVALAVAAALLVAAATVGGGPAAGATAQSPSIGLGADPGGSARIVYATGGPMFSICTMNPDGSNHQCVSSGYQPVPGADGASLFFLNNGGGDPSNARAIYRTDADGADLRPVRAQWPYASPGPHTVDVSPDGSRIVYERWTDNSPFATLEIYSARPDGTGERQLTALGNEDPNLQIQMSQPTFSPDGKRILFFGRPAPDIVRYGHICVMPASGVMPGSGRSEKVIALGEQPRWAPNGRIVYRNIDTGTIMTARPDGTDIRNTRIRGLYPDLSPDGEWLTFTRTTSSSSGIFVGNVDGTGIRRITERGSDSVWFPGSVEPTTPPPTVSVTAPASGEIVGGQPVTFRWTASDDAASQSLALSSGEPGFLNGSSQDTQRSESSGGFTIASGLAGDVRSYTWTPPRNMQWTDRMVRVAVTDDEGQLAVDTSDTLVTRPTPEVPPLVDIGYPDAAVSEWYVGTNHWTSFGARDPEGIARVVARLSTDGGVTFPIRLASSRGMPGFLEFVLPDVPTDAARVKVIATDGLGNSGSDVSPVDFAVVRP